MAETDTGTDTSDGPSTPGGPTGAIRSDHARLRRARAARRAFLGALAVLVLLGLLGFFGIRTRTISATRGPWRLEVTYPQVDRGGLAAPFSATITRTGGIEEPVTLRMGDEFLDALDENGLDPDPAEATSGAGYVQWTFDPPDGGDVLTVSLDARIQPDNRGRVPGWVEIVDHATPRAPRVEFTTWIVP
jgi:hypothetical protein